MRGRLRILGLGGLNTSSRNTKPQTGLAETVIKIPKTKPGCRAPRWCVRDARVGATPWSPDHGSSFKIDTVGFLGVGSRIDGCAVYRYSEGRL